MDQCEDVRQSSSSDPGFPALIKAKGWDHHLACVLRLCHISRRDFYSSQGTLSISVTIPRCGVNDSSVKQAKDLPAAPLFVSWMGNGSATF